MSILITGATGLVGKHLIKKCEQRNIVVHYLTTSKKKIQHTDSQKGFYWDPYNDIIDEAAFEGVTTIIHLAGASVAKRWTKSYKKQILDSRVIPALLLCKTLNNISHNVSQFVSASAIGIYQDSLMEYHSEDSKHLGKDFLANVVKEWEYAVNTIAELGIGVAKLRIGLVLDDKEGALPKMAKPIKNYVGAAFGSGNQWQSWIHVDDLAAMFLFVVEENLTGVYNAVSPNAVTQNKLMSNIAELFSKPLWVPNIPTLVTKLLLGEMSTIVLSSQRVNSSKIQEEGFLFEFPSLFKALKFLFNKEDSFKI